MPHISEIKPGQTLQCWMRSGAPLLLTRDVKGRLSYVVSPKPVTGSSEDQVNQFWGRVVSNDTLNQVILVNATPYRNYFTTPIGASLQARIHYSTFKRVRLLSDTVFPGRATTPADRPTKVTPLGGTEFRPYRTTVEVEIR